MNVDIQTPCNKKGHWGTHFSCFSILFMVFLYVIFQQPFIFIAFIPEILRLFLEGLVLYSLVLITMSNRYTKSYILILFALSIFILMYLEKSGSIRQLLSSMNKIIFFVLFVKMLTNVNTLFKYAKFGWITLWTVLSFISIFSFLGYLSGIIDFKYLEFGDIYEGAYYTYFGNNIFGNIIIKDFGIPLPRIVGYMFEGGQLAFFFGWNIIISKYLIYNPRWSKSFTAINIISGFLTLSMTFVVFMIFYITLLFIKRIRFKKVVSVFFILIIFLSISLFMFKMSSDLGLEQYSSFEDRMVRYAYSLNMFRNSSILHLMFGHGIRTFSNEFGMGINSGLVDLLLERGMILTFFMIFLFIKYSQYDFLVLSFLLYYFMFFNFCWHPIFYSALSIGYASYYYRAKNRALPHRAVKIKF